MKPIIIRNEPDPGEPGKRWTGIVQLVLSPSSATKEGISAKTQIIQIRHFYESGMAQITLERNEFQSIMAAINANDRELSKIVTNST